MRKCVFPEESTSQLHLSITEVHTLLFEKHWHIGPGLLNFTFERETKAGILIFWKAFDQHVLVY